MAGEYKIKKQPTKILILSGFLFILAIILFLGTMLLSSSKWNPKTADIKPSSLDQNDSSSTNNQQTSVSTCIKYGSSGCDSNNKCCFGICVSGKCLYTVPTAAPKPQCTPIGKSGCNTTKCCGGNCVDDICIYSVPSSISSCISTGNSGCDRRNLCCSGNCVNGRCFNNNFKDKYKISDIPAVKINEPMWVYRNERSGIEFELPKSFYVQQTSDVDPEYSTKYNGFYIRTYASGKDYYGMEIQEKDLFPSFPGFKEYYDYEDKLMLISQDANGDPKEIPVSRSVFKVGPYDAFLRHYYNPFFSSYGLEAGFYRDNRAFELRYPGYQFNDVAYAKGVFMHILETMKFFPATGFTLPVPTMPNMKSSELLDTSSWKTYKDEKVGFEIKYPADYSTNTSYRTSSLDEWFALMIGPTTPGTVAEIQYVRFTDLTRDHIIEVEYEPKNEKNQNYKEYFDKKSMGLVQLNSYLRNKPNHIIYDVEEFSVNNFPAIKSDILRTVVWERALTADLYKDDVIIHIITRNQIDKNLNDGVERWSRNYIDARIFNTMLSTIKLF